MKQILKDNAEELLLEDSDPGEVIGRDEQKQQLQKLVFDKILNGGSPVSTVFIYGSSGTGKTYTVDKLSEALEPQLDPSKISLQYINGRRHNTYHQVLVRIWNNLANYLPVEVDGEVISDAKTKGYSASKIYEIINEIIQDKEITLQVTLDEVDKLETEDSKKLISMFYDMRKEGLPVQLTAISNDPYQLSNYDSDIDRRIGAKIHFPKYNAIQLRQILTKFAEMAFHEDKWSESPLSKIAAKIGQTSGSASEAKKMLYHTALKSDEQLNPEHLNDAREEVSKEMVRNEIITRPKHDLLTLKATAELDKDFDRRKLESGKYQEARKNAPTTQNIFEKYKDFCDEIDMDQKSRKTVSRRLDNLEKDNLILGDLRSFGRGQGVSKFWEPLYDNGTILHIIDEKLYLNEKEEEE